MPYPKRLIETDLPIKRISAHARREKSIRHGHISTLHIWWARRPLAACRAVLCAALWPDPADPLCPPAFRQAAITHLNQFAQKMMQSDKYHSAASEYALGQWRTMADPRHQWDPDNPTHQTALQGALLNFIADFANWDNATNDLYLITARALTQTAHESLGGQPGTRPLVVDPFAGGGAIPLEALRVGADAFASDLNPVSVLLNKVVLEYIPRYGQQLADEVRKWGQWVKEQAEKELAEFYPPDPDGAIPTAYMWARTITCEGPSCGITVPTIGSMWLSQKGKHQYAIRPILNGKPSVIKFEIIHNPPLNTVPQGFVKRGSVTCPVCGYTTSRENVARQMNELNGGSNSATLIAVLRRTLDGRRVYSLPNEQDLLAVANAYRVYEQFQKQSLPNGLTRIPDEPLPYLRSIFNVHVYGTRKWSHMFSPRQLVSLIVFQKTLEQLATRTETLNLREPLLTVMALLFDRVLVRNTAFCIWDSTTQCVMQLFNQGQSLPMRFEFAEMVPTSDEGSGWSISLDYIEKVLHNLRDSHPGTAIQADASQNFLPQNLAQLMVTDPPYYDSVPYANLSDFFFVWLKRNLYNIHSDLFAESEAPKVREIVQLAERNESYKYKTKENYESLLTDALLNMRDTVNPEGMGVIVFAHKTTVGWESALQSIIASGWIVTGSWPIDTESTNRLRAKGSAALASSVHIVCRPRETNEIGDWREVLQELPDRIHAWLPRLAQEGIVGADAIFACLGPALEIFSRYASVEKASGEPVPLGEYLEHVWAAVSKEALNMVFAGADTTGFEEDARLTAIWLWTLTAGKDELGIRNDEAGGESDDEEANGKGKGKGKSSAGYVLEYDAARKISQGLGAHLEQLSHLVEVKGENARLLPVLERTRFLFGHDSLKGEKPASARRPTTQQLSLFELLPPEEKGEWHLTEQITLEPGTTTLDKIHQSMLLFASGRSDALKQFLVHNGVGQDERFWRLAQALSALYPSHTDEKRWVDGVLARKKSLGF